MKPFPKIDTQRLTLSELQPKDIPNITSYAANEKVYAFTTNIPSPYTEKDAASWIQLARQGWEAGTSLTLAIRFKKNHAFIGGIGLNRERAMKRAEIGFWLAEAFWNHGFVSEAAKALIDYGFNTLLLNKITSSHFSPNTASGRVMQKCGMTKEGLLREQVRKDSIYYDLVVYGLTRKDWMGAELR